MAMRSTTRAELLKLRELVHFLLNGAGASKRDSEGRFLCFFCTSHLGDYSAFYAHGNSTGPIFTAELSIHHVNGDHGDNVDGNKALTHRTCHKSFHRTQANEERKLKKMLTSEPVV